MNKRLNIIICALITLSLLSVVVGCDGAFPVASKSSPKDHSVKMDGVYHKFGYKEPYLKDSQGDRSCSGFWCHQSDLNGGRAKFDILDSIPTTVSPSCYQCHARLWGEKDKP